MRSRVSRFRGFFHLGDVAALNVAGNHVSLRQNYILKGETLLGVLEASGPDNCVARYLGVDTLVEGAATFGVWGLGSRVWGLGSRVWGLGAAACDASHRIEGSGV
jgi:hypothetical protein